MRLHGREVTWRSAGEKTSTGPVEGLASSLVRGAQARPGPRPRDPPRLRGVERGQQRERHARLLRLRRQRHELHQDTV